MVPLQQQGKAQTGTFIYESVEHYNSFEHAQNFASHCLEYKSLL